MGRTSRTARASGWRSTLRPLRGCVTWCCLPLLLHAGRTGRAPRASAGPRTALPAMTAAAARSPPSSGRLRGEGRTSVLRFWMPDGTTTWHDLVRGEITIDHATSRISPSPARTATRSTCWPRPSTTSHGAHPYRPRRGPGDGDPAPVGVVRRLGLPAGEVAGLRPPAADHRRRQAAIVEAARRGSLAWYRAAGFLPEALANYLALLGWSPGGDREFFGGDVLLAEVRRATRQQQPGAFRHQEARGAERRLDPLAD